MGARIENRKQKNRATTNKNQKNRETNDWEPGLRTKKQKKKSRSKLKEGAHEGAQHDRETALPAADRKKLPMQMVRFLMTFFQILWAKSGPRRREGKQKPRARPESRKPGGR